MRINCVIVEDEPLAMEKMKGFVTKLPYLNLINTFDNSLKALDFLRSNKIDLLFLDIQMDELSGIQLLESLKTETEVIITTAYNEYAIKGYDLNVTDYLLKPFTLERFIQSIEKAQKNIELKRKQNPPESDFIFVKTEYRLEKVFLDDVLYIEGMGDYRRIHTRSKKIMTLQTFRDFEKDIPAHKICRVHKSFMVSINKIETIERDRVKIGSELIPISETYRKQFYDIIIKK